jgi:uncharacterized protein YqgV (UPF0045/DUF77 family)
MDWTGIGKIVGTVVGLITIGTLLYRFSALQTTQSSQIESLMKANEEMIREIEEIRAIKKPSEVCQMKIDRAEETANSAKDKVSEQTRYQVETEKGLRELHGVVTTGFHQINEAMSRIQNAFVAVSK